MFSISSEERNSICWMEEFPMTEKLYQISEKMLVELICF